MNERIEIEADDHDDAMESAPCYFCQSDDHAGFDCPHDDPPTTSERETDRADWERDQWKDEQMGL